MYWKANTQLFLPLVPMLPYIPHEIHICFATWGQMYVLNPALYSVEKTEWFVYVLFIKDGVLLSPHFLVDSYMWYANLAINLDGYIWVVNSLATEYVFFCLEETHLETTVSPLTLIYVGNGCESYSTNIYIPSKLI